MIVRVRSRSARVLAKTNHLASGDVLEFHHVGANDHGKYPHESFGAGTVAGLKDAWPGEPVPLRCVPTHRPDEFELAPLKHGVVRIRRLPLEVPRDGIVIGRLVREEGQRHHTAANAEDPGEGYLATHRRVPLLEVAVPSDPQQLRPAVIFQVWEDDAEPIDATTLARPSTVRVYRLDVEYPAGSREPGWEPPGWTPDREDGDGGWLDFSWPSVRLYLSRSSAKDRKALLESYGATVEIVPSQRVVW